MTDDRFERFEQFVKEEFGVSIIRVDYSETSQILLDELEVMVNEDNSNELI